MSGTFGRDEMNALIGGPGNGDGAEEMAAFRRSGGQSNSHQSASRRTGPQEVDISKMTAAETAKMLSEKARNSSSNNTSRYRRKNKVMAHHQLLAEELSKQQQQEADKLAMSERLSSKGVETDDDEGDEDFVRERRPVQAAVVVSRRSNENRRRRRRSDSSSSSSSSSDEGSQKRARRNVKNRNSRRDRRRSRDDSSSSSSSDEEDDRRRNKRVLASRKMQEEPETIVPKFKVDVDRKDEIQPKEREYGHVEEKEQPRVERKIPQPSKPFRKPRSHSSSDDDEEGSDSSSSSGSESSSDSSSSSESSSDEDEPVRLKPVFVPKHKRNLVQSEERKLEEEELELERKKERKLKRKAESRALVAKELAAAEASLQNDDDDDQDEETMGALNAQPNDDDDVDKENERNAWEIREIERLLKSIDELELRRKEEEEYARRKKLTDAECLKEDMDSGRYQAPGANREKRNESGGSSHLQRFFHRGAFYMDESEWKEGDIRQKAAEYAAAATGDDKIDKSKLPEVMQVKNFGHARQNTRYKGLSKEDTSDKFAHVLPLRGKQTPKR
eukprot:CAMPEP_0116129776 /NCGR_PEP_ID=MMETSP0329-20121206/8101_1 /TAXON_ID=697910 /ORGANISM="Pseudo-nitzschia arenysensis, Strain B593" /LENGTH=558 /DNA_ID=CAMNT_0003624059 /DNA_START=18 /DNA_END=1694 /DNA_ORIENTATION=+